MNPVVAIAWRELRGGLRDFRLFLACLIVGVTVIAAVGLLGARVRGGIHEEAKALLGGDAEIGLANAPITPEQLAFLQRYGKVSASITMRAMATFGEASTLVELKGIDAYYPLVGTAGTRSGAPLLPTLGRGHVVIGQDLSDRLGVKPGERLTLGDSVFTVADILTREPDHIAGALTLGPRIIALTSDLRQAGLLLPGSLIRYNYHILLRDSGGLNAFKDALTRQFSHAPWTVKTFNENNRTMQSLVERLQLFLTLAGLSSLLIGGIGILSAAESYIASKAATIATFKALGAKRNTVFLIYMTLIGVVTLLGIFISLCLGMALCQALLPYLARFFPVSLDAAQDAGALMLAAGFGALTVATFAVAAISTGVEVRPVLLFRGLGNTSGIKLTRGKLALNVLLALALVALIMISSDDKKIAGGFIAAGLVCFFVFVLAARLLAAASRKIRLPPGRMRLACANLHRPGAPVFSIMLSIGIGLSVLVALLLVEGNIEQDIKESVAAQAPSLFFIDIQPSQRDALRAFLASKPYVFDIRSQPMVRGRISKLNGVPVEKTAIAEDVKWAVESDRGFSFAGAPPDGIKIVEGAWWSADYRGAPLVSFDRKLADGMGLHVGSRLTVNILGQDIDAAIASLREVNYMNLHINFALIFSPGVIENFPSTDIATLYVKEPRQEAALIHETAQKFPNVSAIRVRETVTEFEEIVGHIETAVRATAGFTLVSGLMVLASAIASALDKRASDTVIFKVLGARRRDMLIIFLSEWFIVAGVTCVLSCAFGGVGARLILLRFEWVQFRLLPGTIAVAALLTVGFIGLTGLLLQSRAFAHKTGATLRNE